MSDVENRLSRCFTSVFPALDHGDISSASMEFLEAWELLASVTLLAVVEQEFNVKIDLLDLPELNSFATIRAYIDPHKTAPPK